MVQPHLGEAAEIGLVSIDGRYSHAVGRRVPLPRASEREVLYLNEQIGPAEATKQDRTVAEAAPGCAGSDLLYGRVDLMAGVVLELEIAEPSLHLAFGDGAAGRFAAAIGASEPLGRPGLAPGRAVRDCDREAAPGQTRLAGERASAGSRDLH